MYVGLGNPALLNAEAQEFCGPSTVNTVLRLSELIELTK